MLTDKGEFMFEKGVDSRFLLTVQDSSDPGRVAVGRLGKKFAHQIINADPDARIAAAQFDGREIGEANGMTMAFDQQGEQMPEFQGPTAEVVPRIRSAGWTGEPISAT